MFTVRWTRSALDALAATWMQAGPAQRRAITAATHLIDRELANDPHNAGQAGPHGRLVLLVPPLGVAYRIHVQAGVVRVLNVWYGQPNGHRP